jgi:hypothetical protein
MSRRLFLIWTSPLFRDSVRLLLNRPEVEWVGMTADYASAMETVQILNPDTILVEEIDGVIPASIMEILETTTFDFRLIGVSLSENKLSVYRCEQWMITEVEDLVNLVLQ